ncbi:MAG: hypothetical protein IPL73_24100 [Candidatus Obscuribacter sp.]|nr:hypothetical protein [Candidatus Obscuribacter sp.]
MMLAKLGLSANYELNPFSKETGGAGKRRKEEERNFCFWSPSFIDALLEVFALLDCLCAVLMPFHFLCIAGMFYGLFTSFRAFGEIVKAKTSFNSNLQSALDDTPGTTILKYVAYLLCTIAFWMLLKSLSWTSFITEGVVFGGMGQLEFGGFGLYSFWKWTLNKVRCLSNQQHRRTSLLFLPSHRRVDFLGRHAMDCNFKIKAICS